MREIGYAAIGYLLGSILFARVADRFFHCGDVAQNSCDQNPGTVNAFHNGGFSCGVFTLSGDLLKGFLPIQMYFFGNGALPVPLTFALVLAAPVIGHIFPLYYHFRGGKGIATTFGCLLGLFPECVPVAILAGCFLFFSCVVRISPNYYKTALTYLCAEVVILLFLPQRAIAIGFSLITLAVGIRLKTSKEERLPCKAGFLWMY